MEKLIRASRISYGVMVAALAIQQIIYANFRPVILPPWNLSFPGAAILVYIVSVIFILGAAAIIFNKRAEEASLLLGGIFLLLFIFCQVPYELIADANYKHLGVWTSPLKELVLAGGGFIVAGSFRMASQKSQNEPFIISLLEKLIPFGGIFFSITMVVFGIDHFLYPEFVATLVPNWIPGHIFWTYFAGVALMASGVAIIINVKLKLSATLLALMIFIWFIILHIPRGIADPKGLQGNEISSVFEAFGFSGIAYLIAYGQVSSRKS